DRNVTGVQTYALPIYVHVRAHRVRAGRSAVVGPDVGRNARVVPEGVVAADVPRNAKPGVPVRRLDDLEVVQRVRLENVVHAAVGRGHAGSDIQRDRALSGPGLLGLDDEDAVGRAR